MTEPRLSLFFDQWVSARFAPDIRRYSEILLERVAPIFDEVEAEQERHAQTVMKSSRWGSDDYDMALEAAYEHGINQAIGFMQMRSVFLTTGVSGLFHMFEKQLYSHLNQELSDWLLKPIADWKDARSLVEAMANREDDGDPAELRQNFNHPDLRELQLVANAIKHGLGPSYDALLAMKAAVVTSERLADDWTTGPYSALAVPISVDVKDVERYRDAVLRFWDTKGTYWAARSKFK